MEKQAKIFVAGHRGLVGSAIVRRLAAGGYTNLVLRTKAELDLTRQEETAKFFNAERPAYVFLAAARVGGILANNTYKAEFIHENLAIAQNVIGAAHRSGVTKLLNLGSSCIYPKFAPQPIREESLLTGTLEPTNEPYAIAKIAAIKLCRYFNEQFGTNFISAMPTNLYGPNDNFNLETAHVLPALMRKFHLASLLRRGEHDRILSDVKRFPPGFGIDSSGVTIGRVMDVLQKLGISKEAVSLWGTGSPFREFLHVDDLADAVVFLMERHDYKQIGEFVNLGTGSDTTIREIAGMVRDISGFEGEIRWDSSRPDGTPRKLLDVTRLHGLGWNAKIPLRTGLASTMEWYTTGQA
jgi:GDP-L-fucose synthase